MVSTIRSTELWFLPYDQNKLLVELYGRTITEYGMKLLLVMVETIKALTKLRSKL